MIPTHLKIEMKEREGGGGRSKKKPITINLLELSLGFKEDPNFQLQEAIGIILLTVKGYR
jgi:hypothetical protein